MSVRILVGDCMARLAELPDQSVHCCVTSPPYFGLRDYGHDGQIGLEDSPDEYVARLVEVFREVRRVLRDDATLWLNLGDSYVSIGSGAQGENGQMATRRVAQVRDQKAVHGSVQRPPSVAGLPQKNLLGMPWRVAFALQADGWYLRQDIIWAKPNPMPESVRDRCTKSHEYLFLLSKSPRYYFDQEAISEALAPSSVARLAQPTLEQQEGSGRVPGKTNGNMKAAGPRFGGNKYGNDDRAESRTKSGNEWPGAEKRNRRSVWTVTTQPFSEAHFAVFPPALVEPCVKAGAPENGVVLDPFGGSGTTALVADRLQRDAILIELNPEYAAMAEKRINQDAGMWANVTVEAA